jgi:hypothetical protein
MFGYDKATTARNGRGQPRAGGWKTDAAAVKSPPMSAVLYLGFIGFLAAGLWQHSAPLRRCGYLCGLLLAAGAAPVLLEAIAGLALIAGAWLLIGWLLPDPPPPLNVNVLDLREARILGRA